MSDHAPKRRWLRFNLKFLFALMTVFGAWLGWNFNVVQERRLVIHELRNELGADCVCLTLEMAEAKRGKAAARIVEYVRVSQLRHLLGDESYFLIRLERMPDSRLVERMELAFPEAAIEIYEDTEAQNLIASRSSLYGPDRRQNYGTVLRTGIHK